MLENFAAWLNKAATNPALQGKDFRVLLILLSESDKYLNSEITQADIARRLQNKPQNILRSINNLEAQGIIKRLKINRKTYGFKLIIATPGELEDEQSAS